MTRMTRGHDALGKDKSLFLLAYDAYDAMTLKSESRGFRALVRPEIRARAV